MVLNYYETFLVQTLSIQDLNNLYQYDCDDDILSVYNQGNFTTQDYKNISKHFFYSFSFSFKYLTSLLISPTGNYYNELDDYFYNDDEIIDICNINDIFPKRENIPLGDLTLGKTLHILYQYIFLTIEQIDFSNVINSIIEIEKDNCQLPISLIFPTKESRSILRKVLTDFEEFNNSDFNELIYVLNSYKIDDFIKKLDITKYQIISEFLMCLLDETN